MVVEDRVKYSEDLVADFNAMGPKQWSKMRKHPHFFDFMQEYLTAYCITDFWAFMKFGVYTRAMAHYYEPLHGPDGLAGYLSDWHRKDEYGQDQMVNVKCVFWAREHCKTQQAIAWDCWQFARDPNTRLLVRAFTDPKAMEILGGVKELLDSPQFRRNFPHVRPATKKGSTTPSLWREDRFRLRRSDLGIRVPSAEACGIGSDPTGGHFNIGHYDDFEVMQNANSEALRKIMFDTWRNDSNLFLAGSRRVFCGTPWSKDAFVVAVKDDRGEFEGHAYDVSVQPCLVKVFDKPFVGEEPILLEDRQTIRDGLAGFPTLQANLNLCQARVRFFSPAVKDVVEEIREVEWNDTTHFRVNRPFSEMLGQPLSYYIGTEKPAAPNRFTQDCIDLEPTEDSPYELTRKSLPEKKVDQGPLVFSSQMMLDPSDPDNIILNPERIKVIKPEDMPSGQRRYYRSSDLSSPKKGKAYTAFTTGFFHANGLYLVHIKHERNMTMMDVILEYLMGVVRVEEWGYNLDWTSMEKAMIEGSVEEFLMQAERAPHKFLSDRGGKYAKHAEMFFKDRNTCRVRKHVIPRKSDTSKNTRVAAQQPMWEADRLFLVLGPGFVEQAEYEALCEEARYFRLDGTASIDILDNVADLISEGRPPRVAKKPKRKRTGDFQRINREAALQNRLRDMVEPVCWPPRN